MQSRKKGNVVCMTSSTPFIPPNVVFDSLFWFSFFLCVILIFVMSHILVFNFFFAHSDTPLVSLSFFGYWSLFMRRVFSFFSSPA